MRDILRLCVELDTFAADTYDRLSAVAGKPDLSSAMSKLAEEERIHVKWWVDLLEAWDAGLIPDIVNDTTDLAEEMRSLLTTLRGSLPRDVEGMNDDQIIETATKIEFYMLEPVFAELLDLTEPGRSEQQREQYDHHVQHLIDVIERHYSVSTLTGFLARVLRSTWRNNIALARHATRDELTGLYNRRGMMNYLRQWTSWSSRYERPLGVMLIDIDEFKSVNDRYGHLAGDALLKDVAAALNSCVRSSDTVARYGGDEFVIVAPETDPEMCTQLGHRILEAVARIPSRDGQPGSVTASIGAAVVSAAFTPGDRSAEELLAAADRRLYAAKTSGKARFGGCDEVVPSSADALEQTAG